MFAVRRRIERLEEKLGGGRRVVVPFANDGETARECIVRYGHDPYEHGVRYIVVAWGKGDHDL